LQTNIYVIAVIFKLTELSLQNKHQHTTVTMTIMKQIFLS